MPDQSNPLWVAKLLWKGYADQLTYQSAASGIYTPSNAKIVLRIVMKMNFFSIKLLSFQFFKSEYAITYLLKINK